MISRVFKGFFCSVLSFVFLFVFVYSAYAESSEIIESGDNIAISGSDVAGNSSVYANSFIPNASSTGVEMGEVGESSALVDVEDGATAPLVEEEFRPFLTTPFSEYSIVETFLLLTIVLFAGLLLLLIIRK